jgi:hypothetical protein
MSKLCDECETVAHCMKHGCIPKQALAAPVQERNFCERCGKRLGGGIHTCTPPAAPVQEPVAWKWHQAPVKTSWGHDMVVADLAIDKDNTVSVYCERDYTAKVEAMFSTSPAQPAPEQYTAMEQALTRLQKRYGELELKVAAQRQWAGLTEDEVFAVSKTMPYANRFEFAEAIEAKLKEKNT